MKFYNKLSFRVTLSISIPIIAIAVLVIVLLYDINYNLTLEKYKDNLETVNRNYIEFIDIELRDIEDKLSERANVFLNKKFKTEQDILEFTKNNILIDSIIFASGVIFDEGKFNKEKNYGFFYSYKNKDEIIDISFQDTTDTSFFDYHSSKEQWWVKPNTTYTSGWTDPYYDTYAGKIDMITYYYPFFIDDQFHGIISLDISLETLRSKLIENEKNLERKISSELYIVSFDSIIIYAERSELSGKNIYNVSRNNKEQRQFNPIESNQILNSAIQRKSGMSDLHSLDNQTLYFAFYSPFSHVNWAAINVIPYNKIDENVAERLSQVTIYIFFFIILLIIIIIFISRYISKPIVKLSNLSLQIANGNYDTLLDLNGKTEIGILARNFNRMQKEVKKREEVILQKNEQLLELDEAKNKFLLLISHEIRTPLNGIVGMTSLIKDSIQDPELEEFIEMLIESVDRLDSFSKRALEITQMQTQGQSISKEYVDVNEIIKNVCDSYLTKLEEKKLLVNYQFDKSNQLNVNKKYFISCIDEIINNAVKFSFDSNSIGIETINKNDSFIIKISNTGEVIPLNKTTEITKSFGLVKEHIDKDIGLGLSFVQSFVNIHKAELNITSNEERTVIVIKF